MNIAIYSPNWVGDAALSLPFVNNIKSKHPDSKIIILCKKWVSSVYLNHPDIGELIVIPRGKNRGVINTFNTGLLLRDFNIDVFYSLTDSFRSSIIMWLSGSIRRIGFSIQYRGLFLTDKVELPPKNVHRSLKYLRLINRTKFDSNGEFIFFTEKELLWGENEIRKLEFNDFVALFPFSIEAARTFPREKISEWIDQSKENYLIFGSGEESGKAEQIVKNNKDVSITSLCGKYSLRKSMILISLCKYAIATDSGLGHISSIVGVPTLSFFGANRARVTRPIGKKSFSIDKSHRCKPCRKNICCLRSITRTDVNSSIIKVLS